jgi:integrase
MELEVERAQVGDPDRLSTESYLDRYLATLEAEGERSPVTIATYRKCFGWVTREIGHIPLTRLSSVHVDDCYAAMMQRGGLSRQTVRLVHRALTAALRKARKRKLILQNPADDASPPTATKSRVKAFSTAQVAVLLRAAEATDPETYALACVLLICGLRRSEVCGLTTDSVDFDAGLLVVRRTVIEAGSRLVERERGKSKAAMRTLSIPSVLTEILRAQKVRVLERALAWGATYKRTPAYLFPDVDGGPMLPQRLTRRMRALMRAAGIKGRSPVHAWRHTSGSQLYDITRDAKTVQQRLGHAKVNTTLEYYVHSSPERDQEAAVHLGRLLEPK